jgi:hypothetical protein
MNDTCCCRTNQDEQSYSIIRSRRREVSDFGYKLKGCFEDDDGPFDSGKMVRFALSYKSKSGGDKLEEYGNALQVIHLIEPSQPLRQKQQESLQGNDWR